MIFVKSLTVAQSTSPVVKKTIRKTVAVSESTSVSRTGAHARSLAATSTVIASQSRLPQKNLVLTPTVLLSVVTQFISALNTTGGTLYTGTGTPYISPGIPIPAGTPLITRPNRWTLFDPSTSETGTFTINPSSHDPGPFTRTPVFSDITTASTILMYNQDDAKKGTFTGTIMNEADWAFFNHWFANDNVLTLTDDLGRQWSIFFETFEPQRVRKSPDNPWYHTFTATYCIVKVLTDI